MRRVRPLAAGWAHAEAALVAVVTGCETESGGSAGAAGTGGTAGTGGAETISVDIDTVWPHAGTRWLSLGTSQPGVTFTLVGDAREPWYVDADGNGSTVIDATDCVVGIGLPGTAANQIRVPVRDGYISYGSQACDAP